MEKTVIRKGDGLLVFKGGECYFLVSEQESNQRNRLKRALKAALPRVTAAPLKNLPGAHLVTERINGIRKMLQKRERSENAVLPG